MAIVFVKVDSSGGVLAGFGLPGDTMIRNLTGNLRGPFLFFAGNLGDPMEPLIVELPDFFYAFHEPGEFLELPPLVVNRTERGSDFNRFLNSFHCKSLHDRKTVDAL
jgi:hypothetical protein